MRLTWFNQVWIANRFKPGMQIVVSGKVDQYLGRLVMNNPEWEQLEQEQFHTNRIVPIYSLTASITQKWMRRMMHQTVTYWSSQIPDFLPASIRSSYNLPDLGIALREIHFPSNQESLRNARKRLAFDEIFLLQLGVLNQKRNWKSVSAKVSSGRRYDIPMIDHPRYLIISPSAQKAYSGDSGRFVQRTTHESTAAG